MFTLHLLGHVHASSGAEPLLLPIKAVALLSYLALEGRPHHREHLAGLLWETPDALRNLRVELARLKGRGVDPFPARQPMLTLRCDTDLDGWLAAVHPAQERELIGWLSHLRGPALSGLEDLGSPAFREWVDQQRQVIHDRVEERLQGCFSQYEQRGLSACAGLVRARAELLGLELSARPPAPHASGPTIPALTWPAQERQLREALARAEHGPQLALLQGYSETRRELLCRVVQGTPWTAVQLQASTRQPLLQAALTQHLWQLLSAEGRAQLWPAQGQSHGQSHGQTPEENLIELGRLMVALDRPLVIALHDMLHPAQWPEWLGAMLGFVLDLPLPLLLVVSTISPGVAFSLGPVLGQLAGPRLHTVTLSLISVQDVIRMLETQPDLSTQSAAPEETRRACATRLIQRSEGIPVYVRALLAGKSGAVQDNARLPAPVRDRLLAHLSSFPPPLREQFMRLAQVYGRFDPALADALLGEAAPQALRIGLMMGLLVHSGATESLTLPHLNFRSSDAEGHMVFSSEVLRSALAAGLPAAERHAVRATLAALLLPTRPCLSLVYASRAGLLDMRELARLALPALPPPCNRHAASTRATEPERLHHARHEFRTPNGYRVGLDGGFLEVVRRGPPGLPPLLTLALPGHGVGRWTLTARVDVAGPPWPSTPLTPCVLGVQAGTGPRVVYSTRPLSEPVLNPPSGDQSGDGAAQRCGGAVPGGAVFGGMVPLGQWFTLSGQGGAELLEPGLLEPGPLEPGPLELSVQAGDLALTVGALRWGDHTLRGLCQAAFTQGES